MAYTSNPYAPKARRLAVNLVKTGSKKAHVARMYGVHRATIGKWLKKATKHSGEKIWTQSSAPHSHPNQLPETTVDRIVTLRLKYKRCAPVLHGYLQKEGIVVSLASVGRVLKREKLVRKKKPASFYTPLPRPAADGLGALVQMDTIHYVKADKSRFYIYTVIDTYSRMGYAEYHPKLSQTMSYAVVMRAQKLFGFHFSMIQTDNGPEFKDWFQLALARHKMKLRHSRVSTPNDNAHIERFNRTLQEECFNGKLPKEDLANKMLQAYIHYYNHERIHLGISLLTPTDFVAKVLS